MRRCLIGLSAIVFYAIVASVQTLGQITVLTYHYDNSRSGQNTSETLLTPGNVKAKLFGKIFSYNVDGFVVAEPLYLPNVPIPGAGVHNVVYVATQHDSVFAFDADSPGTGAPLWTVNFLGSPGVTTVPINVQGCGSATLFTEIGIMSTPVIDVSSGTVYVVAKTMENGSSVFRLHALDYTNGSEKFGGPVVLTAAVPGVGQFNPGPQMQRPGLLLSNGTVYIAFGSNGCDLNAQGWVLAYNASSLQQVGVFDTAPNLSYGASIWQSGAGLASDSNGYVYLATANGTFDINNTGGPAFGDTILKLTLGSGLSWSDYFTPFDESFLSTHDLDLGSGGVVLLPDQPGTFPHLLLAAGKAGTIYVVNRDNMGQFNSLNNNQIVQWLPNAVGNNFSVPVCWNNIVFFAAKHDGLKAFALNNGLLVTPPKAATGNLPVLGVPTISANGASNGVLWIVLATALNSGMLAAYDAGQLTQLYSSSQVSSRDSLGPVAHFVTPTVVHGKVYVGTQTQLAVYGLLPTLSPSSGNNQSATVGTTLPSQLVVQASDPYSGQPLAGVSVTFSDGSKGGTFSPAVTATASDGTAATSYTLPTKSGNITVTATSTGFASASFSVTANPGSAASLVIVSGQNQTATVASNLPAPLGLKVNDAYKNGVPGVPVTFGDNGAGGGFSANPVTSDSTGKVTVSYTTGTKAKMVTITASSPSVTSVNFKAKVVAGSPASLAIASGNNQTAAPSSPLPKPLVVSVQDQYGNPVSGVSVTFADGGAGGTFSSTTATTDNVGHASVTYTTPAQVGTVQISATVSNLNPVIFTETVQ